MIFSTPETSAAKPGTTLPPAPSTEEYKQTLPRSIETAVQKLSIGNNSTFGSEWTVSADAINPMYISETTPKPTTEASIDGASYGVSFNFKYLGQKSSGIRCSATVGKNTYICFSLKTDITQAYDGNLVFYVDGRQCVTASGTGNVWNNYSVPLDEGSHTFEWKAEGASDSYTLNTTNSVMLGDIYFMTASPITAMLETFDTGDLSAFTWSKDGLSADVTWDDFLQDWVDQGSSGLMYADDHGFVAKLGTKTNIPAKVGSSYLILPKVSPETKSTFSFDYKMQLAPDPSVYAAVYIDDVEALRINPKDYSPTPWKNVSIPVPKGNHSIKIGAITENGITISGDAKNCMLIDNISLVSDETSYITIYPKGIQETYEGGFPLTFMATARRADGSEKEGKPTWSVSGGGTITQDGVFTPKKAGVYTVSAVIDGKTAYNEEIIVHPEDYMHRTYMYNGVTYGELTDLAGERHDTGTVSFGQYTPNGSSFSANGFFVLSGKVTNPSSYNYAYVLVKKEDSSALSTHYIIQGDFCQRIWLRFGKGRYTVTVRDFTSIDVAKNAGANANINGFMSTTSKSMTFDVYNTADTKGEASKDARWLFPSYECQSDDFRISNIAEAILAEIGYDAPVSEKLRAIHNWIATNFTYDTVSRDDSTRRLKQDAISVLKSRKAVCEGYTNMFIALERCMGIEGRTIGSAIMNHAWNNTFFNGKWLLVDVTWDDPISQYGDTERELYTYFLTGLTGKDNDHPAEAIDQDTDALLF